MNTNLKFHHSGTGPAGRRAGRVPSLTFAAIHPHRQPAIPDEGRSAIKNMRYTTFVAVYLIATISILLGDDTNSDVRRDVVGVWTDNQTMEALYLEETGALVMGITYGDNVIWLKGKWTIEKNRRLRFDMETYTQGVDGPTGTHSLFMDIRFQDGKMIVIPEQGENAGKELSLVKKATK